VIFAILIVKIVLQLSPLHVLFVRILTSRILIILAYLHVQISIIETPLTKFVTTAKLIVDYAMPLKFVFNVILTTIKILMVNV